MRPAPMVVGEIRAKDSAEMPLIDDDYVVETFASNGPDHAFDVRILPWTPRTRHHLGDAETGDAATHGLIVNSVSVSQEPVWSSVVREGIDQLLGGPGGGRM